MSIREKVNRPSFRGKRQKAKSLIRLSSFYFLLFGSLLVSCNKNSEDRISKNSSTKFQQYYNQGEQLYLKHCSNCHQKNGKGLGLVYPPLNESDYMDKNLKDVLCLIRYGKEGELIVNGKAYNQRMPPMALLSDLEIAEISTYIYNSWSHEKGIIDVKEASDMLQDCN